MPINRFYKDAILISDEVIFLEDQELHHLSHVVRTEVGETVELVNGKGQLALAEVASISRKRADLKVLSVDDHPEPSWNTALALGIPRINRLDMVVEKGTEIGVSKLLLFPGDNSEKKEIFENQLGRLKAISIGAMKQCGRLYLPEITLLPPLKKWKSFPENAFFGDLSPNAPLLYEALQKKPRPAAACFFVGPESGFTKAEIALLEAAKVKGVSLNNNILRTDTAAIAALTILEHFGLRQG